MMKINRLLIANRGEIACRVIRTAKKMGIHTIAVFSEADAHALHVKLADEAYLLGPAESSKSYLSIEKIIALAKTTQADAIHPGYGFLAENADFASACETNGIIFVGPSSTAILAMGDKSRSKAVVEKHKIPLLPGYHGDHQEPDYLLKQALKIGFPLLIKASSGGGGKGMRIVETEKTFLDALASAKREAKSSFNDEKVLLEKYLRKPRHIEIQLFRDQQGNAVYCWDRDCSIQRRHQKIIEEAPAIHLSEKTQHAMGQSAITIAHAINYHGAGTIEFLLDENENYYFMEMNTRLQVEHPVTEMITGFDLVEWQLQIAAGENLPVTQDNMPKKGHAIEVRICAEDPLQQFLPSIGKITHLKEPALSSAVRLDTGLQQGDAISMYYDPMISKLIVHGKTRQEAIGTLLCALNEYHVVGVKTNIDFLKSIIALPDFSVGKISTHFIPEHESVLFETEKMIPDSAFLIASLWKLHTAEKKYFNGNDLYSPWKTLDYWQSLIPTHCIFTLQSAGKTEKIQLFISKNLWHAKIGETLYSLSSIAITGDTLTFQAGSHTIHASVYADRDALHVFESENHFVMTEPALLREKKETVHQNDPIRSPMPGTIIAIHVKEGDTVKPDEPLITLEAMKMEHTLYSKTKATVKKIGFKMGEQVSEGAELLSFEALV